jgi:nitrile hydratase subunit beta
MQRKSLTRVESERMLCVGRGRACVPARRRSGPSLFDSTTSRLIMHWACGQRGSIPHRRTDTRKEPMNGIHDMGGMTTFGLVPRDETSPFHAEWEKRLAGIGRHASDRLFHSDEFRHAIERLDPAVYLSTTYYERWLAGLERLLIEKGLIDEDDMTATLDGWRPQPGVAPVEADDGDTPPGDDGAAPRYSPGDRVRVRNAHAAGHTRVPRYVRGRRGVIDRFLSAQVLPDDLVMGNGAHRWPVYAVRFEARELWGEQASPRDTVLMDLWENYLLPDGDEEPREAT